MKFSEIIKQTVDASGLPVYKFAKRIGVSDRQVRRWIDGESSNVTARNLRALEDNAGVPAAKTIYADEFTPSKDSYGPPQ